MLLLGGAGIGRSDVEASILLVAAHVADGIAAAARRVACPTVNQRPRGWHRGSSIRFLVREKRQAGGFGGKKENALNPVQIIEDPHRVKLGEPFHNFSE